MSILKARDIPNLITLVRLLLVAPVLWLLLERQYSFALLLFLVAGLSDGVDGFLAKTYGWTSYIGGILDPLADKLLLAGSILVLGWLEQLPRWLVALIVGRDLLIVSMAVTYHYLIEPFQAQPLLISKLNTLAQIGLVFLILFAAGVRPLPEALLTLAVYGTAATTAWSGGAYVWIWSRLAWHKRRQSHVH